MEYNINELLKMSNGDLLELMQSLSNEEKRNVWNIISDNSTDKIRDFKNHLKAIKIPKVVQSGKRAGKEYNSTAFKEFIQPAIVL